MLPGKKYKPEDFVQIAWRRRWLVIVSFVIVLAGAITYAQLQPNRYRAQTAILIVPQQVPESYVQPTVTTLLSDRLNMISQQILSRARLERIIEEFNLYPDLRRTAIMEDIVEQMRTQDIKMGIQSKRADAGSFTVGFESDDPRTALLVAERLASLFIKENLDERAVLADATSQFLDAELEQARRRLIDHEEKLKDYKRRHSGSLPTEVATNLQAIQNAQLQLTALTQVSHQDADRRLLLERALVEAQAELNAPAQPSSDPNAAQPASTRLEAARAGLRALELRLKPEHPDIVRAKRVIRDLEKEAEAESLTRPVGEGPSPANTVALKNLHARIKAIQGEIEAIDRRKAARQTDEGRLRATLSAYQARVEAAPARESEMVELMRDYETLKGSYDDLLRKSESSKRAVNLERRQIGEQFKIVDAARLPGRPISPNRPQIIGAGAVLGLALGLALVVLLEYRDSSVKTDEDVVASLALPVLAMIPEMVTRAERRANLRRRRLIAATSIVGIVAAAGVAAWKLQLFERWIG